ncbi:MAG: FixH family protein [Cyclobacteriaceae bacterium]
MTWPRGIILSFVLFCSFVIWIVIQAFQENIDLVSDTYYQDELVYQDRIDQRTNLHESGLSVAVEQTADEVVFTFPKSFSDAEGKINFYNPKNALFDKSFDIKPGEDGLQQIDKSQLVKGRYKVKVSWQSAGKGYFEENEIFIK